MARSMQALLCAAAAAGIPSAAAVAPAARDPVLAADAQEQRAQLVRREMLSGAAPVGSLSEHGARNVPEAPNEIIDRIMDGMVNGSTLVGDETAGEKVFWLEAGCRSLTPDPVLAGKFAGVAEKLGKIQCCRDEPHNNGTFCYRKHQNTCLSANTTELATFSEAAIACETNGYRLCTKQELLMDSAAGCCHAGCGIDDMLVWTSTYSFKGLKDSNEVLKTEIENVKNDNLRIEAEHKELASKMGELEAVVNNTKIPEGYVPPPPEETLRQAPIHTITGEEAEALARENSRLWYEVEAMRRENDDLKDHIVAIVNGTIVSRNQQAEHAPLPEAAGENLTEEADSRLSDETMPVRRVDSMSRSYGAYGGGAGGDVRAAAGVHGNKTQVASTAGADSSLVTPAPGTDVKVGSQVVHSGAARAGALLAAAAAALAFAA